MSRTVPVSRRNLFQDRRRAMLAVAGLAVALLLVLVLEGILSGAMRQATAYVRTSPADLIVSQANVRTMHMSASALPADLVERARRVPGVAWADGIRYTTVVVSAPGGRQLSYVIGYEANARGGPRRIVDGEAPGPREVVLDELAADALDVSVGDAVELFGAEFRVSGESTGGTSIVNSTAFIRTEDFERLRGPAISYVLVGRSGDANAAVVAGALRDALPGTTVQTREAFARQERNIVKDMSADVMRIMATIGLLIALAVVALALFTLTLAKLREYGVMRALGARRRRLAGVVLAQAVWSVGLATLTATALALVIGVALHRAAPTVEVVVEPTSVLRTGLSALVVGALGALFPLRRVIRVDPASAFRRSE